MSAYTPVIEPVSSSPVERLGRADVHQHQDVNLPIFQGSSDDSPGELALGSQSLLLLESVNNHLLLDRTQESGLLRPVVDHPERSDGDEEGQKTLPDELG